MDYSTKKGGVSALCPSVALTPLGEPAERERRPDVVTRGSGLSVALHNAQSSTTLRGAPTRDTQPEPHLGVFSCVKRSGESKL